jgi:hypothetical protein
MDSRQEEYNDIRRKYVKCLMIASLKPFGFIYASGIIFKNFKNSFISKIKNCGRNIL